MDPLSGAGDPVLVAVAGAGPPSFLHQSSRTTVRRDRERRPYVGSYRRAGVARDRHRTGAFIASTGWGGSDYSRWVRRCRWKTVVGPRFGRTSKSCPKKPG